MIAFWLHSLRFDVIYPGGVCRTPCAVRDAAGARGWYRSVAVAVSAAGSPIPVYYYTIFFTSMGRVLMRC